MRKSCAHGNEQFFVFSNRDPVRIKNVRKLLKKTIELIGLDTKLYNTHSLRAGRSVDLVLMGIQIPVVRKLGRWTSNAIYAYLKL